MTRVYLVRHAQSDRLWPHDNTKPLTPLGLEERHKVTRLLETIPIDVFLSSPFKRSVDTISPLSELLGKSIHTDARFRERMPGENGYAVEMLEKRWADFGFCEEGGETIAGTQKRNVEALRETLDAFRGKSIVIGTHGTAMSVIINHYDPSFGCDDFKRIWHVMPYVIRLDFEGQEYISREELLFVESFH